MARKGAAGRGGGDTQLSTLIDSATTSPADALDLGLTASIKRLVRASDDNVRLAFCLLIAKLKNKHSQVRYLALLIVDELFTRSKLFRTLIVDDFETFMVLSVGYHTDCPLPPPVSRATVLRAKSMEVLEKWNDSFGPHYKPLRLGYEYLKNTLHLQFPNLRQAAAQAEQQRKEREERSRALVLDKYENLKDDFPALCSDIEQTLKQLDECFEILNAANKKEDVSAQLSNEDRFQEDGIEDDNTNSLRHALAQAACQAAVACETQDNKPVFDTVRDLCRLIASQHFPAVQSWMSILMRVDTQDRESHGFLFKHVIDIRNRLSSTKAKCIELGIDIREHSEVDEADDGIIWEEGGVENDEAFESHTIQVSEAERKEAALNSEEEKPSALSQSTSVSEHSKLPRSKLLEEAPVLPWGSYLDRWGLEHAVPVNQRGLLLESHWGRVDFDALLPADKVLEMNMRASYYTSAKTEIPPCLAPLKKGGLCQRRDLRVCPLHGPIIPRDSSGNPLASATADETSKERPSQGESSACVESSVSVASDRMDFVKDIAAKAVANVRAQDALELSKKKEKKLQAKRNREHNAAVLREAALANTFQGLGEAIGEDLEKYGESSTGHFKQQNKRAKASLRAMLQPKPTAKDRLAERLLNSRANEATLRELTRDEDAAYRESFANQW